MLPPPLPAPVSINPTNPFLLLDVVRARDFSLNTGVIHLHENSRASTSRTTGKPRATSRSTWALRWDFQQAYSIGGSTYLKLNDFVDNTQPRLGFIWDFTGEGRGKFFANYARSSRRRFRSTSTFVQAAGRSERQQLQRQPSECCAAGSSIVPGRLRQPRQPCNTSIAGSETTDG